METKKMTYMQALRLAMDEEMARDEKVILLGQDVGILGGAYGVTGDLYHKYGPDRIIDSPLAENAIVGFGNRRRHDRLATYHGDNEDGLQHVLVRPYSKPSCQIQIYVRRTDRKNAGGGKDCHRRRNEIRPSSQPVRIRPVCGFPGT